MATLSITHSFVSGTLAKSSEVNQNFLDVISWANGNISHDNFDTFTGALSWVVTSSENAIEVVTNSNEGTILINSSAALDPNKAIIKVIDSGVQTSNLATAYFSSTSTSSTKPVFRLDQGGAQVFAALKDRLEFPVRTLAQRDAIVSPENGSILAVEDNSPSRHRGLHIKQSEGWSHIGLPPGMIIDFAGPNAPDGFLVCDGTAVSRTTYATLFAAIGTTWGVGDGATTFNLPDLRRRATIGEGGTAVAGPANTLGSTGGHEQLQGHTHTVSTQSGFHEHAFADVTSSDGGSYLSSQVAGPNYVQYTTLDPGGLRYRTQTSVPHTHSVSGTTGSENDTHIHTLGTTGSGNAENMQPSAVVKKCIKW